jgi:aspartyl-tRNA(Asn)/glutamyl-tRNA(Gln) amidotransferase subunit C
MSEINKKSLEHLADLARLELSEQEEEGFVKDLDKILDYFKELQRVDTDNVESMTGETELKNIVREDVVGQSGNTGKGNGMFPEAQDNYLKVPPVF